MTRCNSAVICFYSVMICSAFALPNLPAQEKPDKNAAEQDSESLLEDYVTFTDVGLKVRQPKGYQKEKSFTGFGNEAAKASILISRLPAPFSEVSKGFTKENLATRGWTLHSREDVKLDDQPAILIHFEQPQAGTVFEKWVVILGDPKQCWLVTATYPQTAKKDVEPALKAAVLTARRTDVVPTDPRESLPFTFTEPRDLKFSGAVSGSLLYTVEGKIPVKSAAEPLLVVAPSIGKVPPISDLKGYAERRLHNYPQMTDLKVDSVKEIKIDGLQGYEIHGQAVDTKEKIPLKLYQVILFEEGSYILLFGCVGEKQAAENLPVFEKVAKSIKRKNKEE